MSQQELELVSSSGEQEASVSEVASSMRLFSRLGREWLAKSWGRTWPVLLVLLSPGFWLIRSTIRLYVIKKATSRRRVNARMICPGCGWQTKHEFRYHSELRKIVHQCPRCKAEWLQDPFKSGDWDVQLLHMNRRHAVIEEGIEVEGKS